MNNSAVNSTLVDLLQQRASLQSQRLAYTFLVDGEEDSLSLSYGELDHRARAVAARLQEQRAVGERVMLVMPPGLDYLVGFFGCLYAGATAVPVAMLGRPERVLPRLQAIADDAQAAFVLTTEQVAAIRQSRFQSLRESAHCRWLVMASADDGWASVWREFYPQPEDLAFLQYTSGSTARPKGVMVQYRHLSSNLACIHQTLRLGSEERFVSWLPPYHDMGLVGSLLTPLYGGFPCYFMSPSTFLGKPLRWLRAISRYGGTISCAPDFAYGLCVESIAAEQRHDVDLRSWRIAISGAEPVRATTLRRFSKTFAPQGFRETAFYPAYGLAESTLFVAGGNLRAKPLIAGFDGEALRQGRGARVTDWVREAVELVSCGRSWSGQTVEIVDPQSQMPCTEGRVGEIWLSGPSVAGGYWGRGESSASTFQAHLESGDGPYLRTGDLGFMSEGELFVTGRLKDLIIISGANFYPQDLEQCVGDCHPACLANACVAFALEQAQRERVVIVAEIARCAVDRGNPSSADQIINAIRQSLARRYDLALVAVVLIRRGTLPRTTSGKLQRQHCKARFLEGSLRVLGEWREDPVVDSPADGADTFGEELRGLVERTLISMLSKHLSWAPGCLSEDSSLAGLGMDSLKLAQISQAVESTFGAHFEAVELLQASSISQLAETIAQRMSDPAESGSVANTQANHRRQSAANFDPTQVMALLDDPTMAELRMPRNLSVSRQQLRRVHIDEREFVDFASCNYLGLDHHPAVKQAVTAMVEAWGVHPSWTRAVASPAPYLELETRLAELIGAADTLVFPNVAMLNMGVLPILAGPTGVLLADLEAHQTIQDACRYAATQGITHDTFRPDDVGDLRRLLEQYRHRSPIVIAVDGVYSMSVRYLDLPVYCELARQYNAWLYVDDAHGFGIIGESPTAEMPYGQRGNGIVKYFGLDYVRDRIVYVSGLSKAYSSYGAFVSCADSPVKQKLGFASNYIFSGPVPVASLASALAAIQVNAREGEGLRQTLHRLSARLVAGARALGFEVDNTGNFPIVFVVIGDFYRTAKAIDLAWQRGLLITPGLYPAVPYHRGGLRFTVTTANTDAEIDHALAVLEEIQQLPLELRS